MVEGCLGGPRRHGEKDRVGGEGNRDLQVGWGIKGGERSRPQTKNRLATAHWKERPKKMSDEQQTGHKSEVRTPELQEKMGV